MSLPMLFQKSIATIKLTSSAALSTCQVRAKSVGIGLAAMLLLAACGSLTSEEADPKADSPNSPNISPETVEPETVEPESGEPIASEQNQESEDNEEPGDSTNTFDLLPGFYPDPATDTGTAAGTIEASSLTGTDSTASGSCEGFINESPDHQVNLRDDFSYLTLGVESSARYR